MFHRLLALLVALLVTGAALAQADGMLLGIVSISPAEANNARFIKGASEQAAEYGWRVQVIDAQGAADQANSAIQNLVTRRAGAIIDMVFPTTSLNAGLVAAERAGTPVGTWGGGFGRAVVAVNGSGGPMAVPVTEQMVSDMGGTGSVLALTYHTGQVCREREEEMDRILADYPNISVTKNEVRIPGYLQDGAQYAAAWLASHPAGREPLAIWGCWDDPALGAIATMKQQNRSDVLVYGVNGNAEAILAVQTGWMTATAWQQSFAEGKLLVATLKEAIDAKAAGQTFEPVAVEIVAIVVNADTVEQFILDYPEAVGN
jgi:ribose transport system substrate-binding protein